MDLIISGYTKIDLDQIRYVLEEIKRAWPTENDQRIVKMALARMYQDVVQPPMADRYPTREELLDMGALPITRNEQMEGFRKFGLLMDARLRELRERARSKPQP